MTRSLTLEELVRWDREHYWHAFTQMAEYQPLVIERAEGVWLFEPNGRALLDAISSMWCNVHGHNHPAINKAISSQLNKVAHVSSLGISNPTTVELAKRLVDLTQENLQTVFFSSDGSCAIEVALKMAFQYWRQCPQPEPQRNMFLAIGDAYHGDTLGSVSVGGVARFQAMFAPLLFDVVRGPCPDSYRLPPKMPADQACEFYLAQYRDLMTKYGDRLAGLIIEPLVQGAAGMIMHPSGFLRGLKKLAEEYGVLFIADEVATGMGRTGKLWASEWEEIQPDFLCIGKGLSGGYLPVAATLTSRKIWNAFLGSYAESKSFFHGHTYGGNPLGAAASLATLELFESEQTLVNVKRQADYLAECLKPIAEHPQVGDVRQRGLIAAIELVENPTTRQAYPWSERRGWRVCQAALEKNVWLRPLGNVVVVMPPLCVQEQHIEQIVAAIQFGIHSATID